MFAVRRLLAQRNLAILFCAATLLLKLLVPTGYMIGNGQGGVTVELCSGVASRPMAMHGDMPDHGGKEHGKAELPCAFAGLAAATLDAIDPVQLAALIAAIIAAGIALAVPPAPAPRTYLRPPLRGPPADR